jgi:hypothetical protein
MRLTSAPYQFPTGSGARTRPERGDSSLQIAMLRRLHAGAIQDPWGRGRSIINTGEQDILVVTEEQRARLIEINRQAVLPMPATREERDRAGSAGGRDGNSCRQQREELMTCGAQL